MLELRLDASRWVSREDFYRTILPLLGAPDWHGHNLDALADTIGGGDVNVINPPFSIHIVGAAGLSRELAEYIERFAQTLRDLRSQGIPVDVRLEL